MTAKTTTGQGGLMLNQEVVGILTQAEAQRLAAYEVVIEDAKQAFRRVGEALMAVKAEGLYRESGTFEDYCLKRWGFSKRRTAQLRGAAQVAGLLEQGKNFTPPANEHVASIFTPLLDEPERIKAIWTATVEKYGDDPTAAQVREVRGYVWLDAHERELATVQGHGSRRRAYLLTEQERVHLRGQATRGQWTSGQLRDAVDNLTADRGEYADPLAYHKANATASGKAQERDAAAAAAEENTKAVAAFLKDLNQIDHEVDKLFEATAQTIVLARFSREGGDFAIRRLGDLQSKVVRLTQLLQEATQ